MAKSYQKKTGKEMKEKEREEIAFGKVHGNGRIWKLRERGKGILTEYERAGKCTDKRCVSDGIGKREKIRTRTACILACSEYIKSIYYM